MRPTRRRSTWQWRPSCPPAKASWNPCRRSRRQSRGRWCQSIPDRSNLRPAAAASPHPAEPPSPPYAEAIADIVAPKLVGALPEKLRHRRQLVVRRDQRSSCIAWRRERKQKRIRATIDQMHLDVLPVLVGVVVNQRPALQHATFAGFRHDQPITDPPQRRFGDVPDGDRPAVAAQKAESVAGRWHFVVTSHRAPSAVSAQTMDQGAEPMSPD